MTPLQRHREKWKAGCGNSICDGAKNIVLVRGTLPCDLLCVAEAPGESEDVLGRPMVGPAGKLFDRILADATGDVKVCPECGRKAPEVHRADNPACDDHPFSLPRTVRVAFTNIVGCIPRNEDGTKATEPDVTEVRQCAGRLSEMIALARPRLIVTVGLLSTKFCPVPAGVRTVAVTHPAAILRANIAARGLMVQKCVVTLRDAVEGLR